jgi:hypothetical protein
MKNVLSCCLAATLVLLLVASLNAQAIVSQQWAQRTFSPDHGDDAPCGVAVDSAGNIYVGGRAFRLDIYDNFSVTKFTPEGQRLWTALYNSGIYSFDIPYDFTRDVAGNLYLTGISGPDDYLTVKFNAQGELQWVAEYDSPNHGADRAMKIVVDERGNVYVTGESAGVAPYQGQPDCVTIKYNAQGVQEWVARYDGAPHGAEEGLDLALDAEGQVYVLCQSSRQSVPYYGSDWVLLKYSPHGALELDIRYSPPYAMYDPPFGFVLDDEANIYVACNTYLGLTINKYSSLGIHFWQVTDNLPGGLNYGKIARDANGDLVITGLGSFYSNGFSYTTVKYTADGIQEWVKISKAAHCRPLDLMIDAERNIYLTGYQNVPGESWSIASHTLKYNPQGVMDWIAQYRYRLNDGGFTEGTALTMDNQGSVIVAGIFQFGGGITDSDILTVKYNQTAGNVTATMTPVVSPILIPAQGGSFNYNLLTVNSVSNNIEVDYWWEASYPDSNYPTPLPGTLELTLPLDSTMVLRTQRVPGSAPPGDYQYILNAGDYPDFIWATDTIPITKLTTGQGSWVDAWTQDDKPVAPEELSASLSIRAGLMSASPNPFNPTSTISYQLSTNNHVNISVFDVAGRQVAELVDDWIQPGSHQATFDGSELASGLYFVRMVAGDYNNILKIMLEK